MEVTFLYPRDGLFMMVYVKMDDDWGPRSDELGPPNGFSQSCVVEEKKRENP